ncbi:MAG: hypothetical protein HY222_05130 [Thaumarchaeota archaeon]|nr:hypothetical protein [Nitrososphaerota archaeon]MBI3641759.1 hypothetical protein [Nitrososphaerota archaeon]
MSYKAVTVEIATTKYETDRELIFLAMESLQSLCEIKDSFLISNPMERFGWAFFKILFKVELLLAMQQKLADQIAISKGKKHEDKFISFLTNFFEYNNCKVKVKLLED